ncbi:hypothetical protein [Porphyromonas levii]|uniref:hypothetical protein n=1 Tax=Porphyromonas levii TaxID=28114 RepID=UPI00037BFE28|nr:hypothetical protein [Porphyromonas levii]
MKKIIATCLMAIATVALTGCWKKDKPRVLEQGAMLYINVDKTTRAMDVETRASLPIIEGDEQPVYTPLEVVKDAQAFFMDTEDGLINSPLAIGDEQKDFENARIKMWGEQVINRDGTLNTYFINARNIYISGTNKEYGLEPVIAYIPNAVMEQAKKDILAAYESGDYPKVYEIFHKAYTAIPCTTKQWKALKEKGEQ